MSPNSIISASKNTKMATSIAPKLRLQNGCPQTNGSTLSWKSQLSDCQLKENTKIWEEVYLKQPAWVDQECVGSLSEFPVRSGSHHHTRCRDLLYALPLSGSQLLLGFGHISVGRSLLPEGSGSKSLCTVWEWVSHSLTCTPQGPGGVRVLER